MVTGTGGQQVKLFAKGEAIRREHRSGSSTATFTKLTPGTTYTVTVGGREVARLAAIARPTPATRLVVHTTDQPTSVRVAWQHRATRATGGTRISYDVTATSATAPTITAAVVGQTSVTLAGLDPTALYTFRVTPRNSAGRGRSTTASMTRTLAQIHGTGAIATTVDTPPAPTRPAVVLPTPAPPAPAPAPAPSTKTIYVCPDGYATVGELCRTTAAYTYDVRAYTYHEVFVKTGQTVDFMPWVPGVSTHCTNGGTYYATGPQGEGCYRYDAVGYLETVKDATPAGYSDTGTDWRKRDAAPAGYLDDGTQWVKTVAKEARVVPA